MNGNLVACFLFSKLRRFFPFESIPGNVKNVPRQCTHRYTESQAQAWLVSSSTEKPVRRSTCSPRTRIQIFLPLSSLDGTTITDKTKTIMPHAYKLTVPVRQAVPTCRAFTHFSSRTPCKLVRAGSRAISPGGRHTAKTSRGFIYCSQFARPGPFPLSTYF